MRLVPVDPYDDQHVDILYQLLRARPSVANVSHKRMPTPAEHREFVRNHPYADWCLIETAPYYPVAGSVFISQPARPRVVGDELSVDLFANHRSRGYAADALSMMMKKHRRSRYIANTALTNYASMALFAKLGFIECQRTFELIVPREKAE